jgi:hypothetical protein
VNASAQIASAVCPFYTACLPSGCTVWNDSEERDEWEGRLDCIRGDYEDCPLFLEMVLRCPGEHFITPHNKARDGDACER